MFRKVEPVCLPNYQQPEVSAGSGASGFVLGIFTFKKKKVLKTRCDGAFIMNMNNASAKYLRETLVPDPEVQWRLRRSSIGLTYTLPMDEEAQRLLIEERRLAVEATYKEIESS